MNDSEIIGKMLDRINEPELLEDHFPECAAQEGDLCTCDDVERDLRDSFAAMKADWKNDAARCY